jgi:hypothetical protein
VSRQTPSHFFSYFFLHQLLVFWGALCVFLKLALTHPLGGQSLLRGLARMRKTTLDVFELYFFVVFLLCDLFSSLGSHSLSYLFLLSSETLRCGVGRVSPFFSVWGEDGTFSVSRSVVCVCVLLFVVGVLLVFVIFVEAAHHCSTDLFLFFFLSPLLVHVVLFTHMNDTCPCLDRHCTARALFHSARTACCFCTIVLFIVFPSAARTSHSKIDDSMIASSSS